MPSFLGSQLVGIASPTTLLYPPISPALNVNNLRKLFGMIGLALIFILLWIALPTPDTQVTGTVITGTTTAVSVIFVLLVYLLGRYGSLPENASDPQREPYEDGIWLLTIVVWTGTVSIISSLAGELRSCPSFRKFGLTLFVLLIVLVAVAETWISWKTLSD